MTCYSKALAVQEVVFIVALHSNRTSNMSGEKNLHKRSLNLMVCCARRWRNLKPNLTKPIVKTFSSCGFGLVCLVKTQLTVSNTRGKLYFNGKLKKSNEMKANKVWKLFQPSKLEISIRSRAPCSHISTHAHTHTHTAQRTSCCVGSRAHCSYMLMPNE